LFHTQADNRECESNEAGEGKVPVSGAVFAAGALHLTPRARSAMTLGMTAQARSRAIIYCGIIIG